MNSNLTFRLAEKKDLLCIVRMLSEDALGKQREQFQDPLPPVYISAFEKIKADANQELTVAEIDGKIAGTFHLTYIQYLTHTASLRAQIEGVRVEQSMRSAGIGTAMIRYAIDRARGKGCTVVQLTSDKRRTNAIRFYESLGFAASHEGFKLKL